MAPLKRSAPEAIRAWRQRSKRLKPMSDKRRADLPRRKAVRAEVLARDGRCVAEGWRGECFGPLEFGHIVKASQGGAYETSNGWTVCDRHNILTELYRKEAEELGLVNVKGEPR